ncbi:unnamed protein product [Durusdinium trenchii]|uniref:Uncharacterized protein n=1 Tax=Durusdinium trenchii TaxID=1381693 RepID=A0ABP0QI11_9DINO
MFRFFSLAVLVAFSLVSARPTNSSCEKCDGDAAPLLQVKANQTRRKQSICPCLAKRCSLVKFLCREKNMCCKQAKKCRGGGGGASTSVTDLLNGLISSAVTGAVYKGGQGVIFRDENDGFFGNDAFKVLPGSLISNDIIAPNPVFPADDNGNIDPNVASVGVILDEWAFNTLFGTNTQDEDYYLGVFYPADSNSVDQRCRSEQNQNRYDCRIFNQGARG